MVNGAGFDSLTTSASRSGLMSQMCSLEICGLSAAVIARMPPHQPTPMMPISNAMMTLSLGSSGRNASAAGSRRVVPAAGDRSPGGWRRVRYAPWARYRTPYKATSSQSAPRRASVPASSCAQPDRKPPWPSPTRPLQRTTGQEGLQGHPVRGEGPGRLGHHQPAARAERVPRADARRDDRRAVLDPDRPDDRVRGGHRRGRQGVLGRRRLLRHDEAQPHQRPHVERPHAGRSP